MAPHKTVHDSRSGPLDGMRMAKAQIVYEPQPGQILVEQIHHTISGAPPDIGAVAAAAQGWGTRVSSLGGIACDPVDILAFSRSVLACYYLSDAR